MRERRETGFTLLEVIFVIGLLMIGMLLSFYSKKIDLEQLMARTLGSELFQYNNAVRNYIAKNNQMESAVYLGSSWLKNVTCGGSLEVGAEYLPCTFSMATDVSPMKIGSISLATNIQVTGVAPNRKITATTITTPFKLVSSGIHQTRSDLAGVAAITAASGYLPGSTGAGFATTTDASYSSNPLNGTITMVASNNATQDIWLRTDGGNRMHASLEFDSLNSVNREIIGASRIQNFLGEALYLGRKTGASSVSGAGVIVDADAEIAGKLRIRNEVNVDNSANVGGSVTASDNVTAGSALMGQIFYDSNNASYFVDPSAASNLNAIVAEKMTVHGRVDANEYVQIGGIATEGERCYSNGLIGRNVNGLTLSCQSGVWRRSGTPTEAFALSGTSQEYCYIRNLQTSTCGCSAGKSPFFTGFSYAEATPYFWYYLCRG